MLLQSKRAVMLKHAYISKPSFSLTKSACVVPRMGASSLGINHFARWVRRSSPSDNGSATSTLTQAPDTVEAKPQVDGATAASIQEEIPSEELAFVAPTDSEMFWTKFKLAFARPWRRFKWGSVLAFKIEGEIPDQRRGFFDSGSSVPKICAALIKAAKDPRVAGLCIEISPVSAGWATLLEIRRHLAYFRQSGKFTVAYIQQGGEKEYYLATACEEVYAPSSSYLRLLGFSVAGSFLRGTFDKIGIEPQVKRIGKYKSAGDQLLRTSMSEPQREQLSALVDDIYEHFVSTVAIARGKTEEDVKQLLERGVYDLKQLKEEGWLTDLRYEDEIIKDLEKRTESKEDKLKKVSLGRMATIPPSTYGMKGKKRIVVLRNVGAIVGKSSTSASAISPDLLTPRLRALGKDKKVAAVVLRINSPGGDAFASDLMWREIKLLAAKKPVIASMGDVAASGGYYLSMAANKIVAEALTITGSVGVVTGKLNAQVLYDKIGYSKELISRGRFAELESADNRPFNAEEEKLFDDGAQHAYASFRNKAAESRGLPIEKMEEVAQGRVWTGAAALNVGLVDALGGVNRAIALAKQAAGIPQSEMVTVLDFGRARTSPLSLFRGGASAAFLSLLKTLATSPNSSTLSSFAADILRVLPALSSLVPFAESARTMDALLKPGQVSYLMTDVDLKAIGSSFGSSNWSGGNSCDFLSNSTEEGMSLEEAVEELII